MQLKLYACILMLTKQTLWWCLWQPMPHVSPEMLMAFPYPPHLLPAIGNPGLQYGELCGDGKYRVCPSVFLVRSTHGYGPWNVGRSVMGEKLLPLCDIYHLHNAINTEIYYILHIWRKSSNPCNCAKHWLEPPTKNTDVPWIIINWITLKVSQVWSHTRNPSILVFLPVSLGRIRRVIDGWVLRIGLRMAGVRGVGGSLREKQRVWRSGVCVRGERGAPGGGSGRWRVGARPPCVNAECLN